MAFRANFKQLFTPIPVDSALIHDGWIALVIAATAEVSALSDPLIGYRQHADQQLGEVRGSMPTTWWNAAPSY